MGYENCGEKNALWLAKVISGLNPDSKGIPTSIIELSETNDFHYKVERYIKLHVLQEELGRQRVFTIGTHVLRSKWALPPRLSLGIAKVTK